MSLVAMLGVAGYMAAKFGTARMAGGAGVEAPQKPRVVDAGAEDAPAVAMTPDAQGVADLGAVPVADGSPSAVEVADVVDVVELRASPRAKVYLGGKLKGRTPLLLQRSKYGGAPVQFELRAAGYQRAVVQIDWAMPVRSATLRRRAGGSGARAVEPNGEELQPSAGNPPRNNDNKHRPAVFDPGEGPIRKRDAPDLLE